MCFTRVDHTPLIFSELFELIFKNVKNTCIKHQLTVNDFIKCCLVSYGQKVCFFMDMLCIVPNADRDFKECLIPVALKVTGLNFKQAIPIHSFFYLKGTVCTMRPVKEVPWIKSLHISLYLLFSSFILLPYKPLHSSSCYLETNVSSDDQVMAFPSSEHFKMVDTSQKG
jgi:hypothetical protein